MSLDSTSTAPTASTRNNSTAPSTPPVALCSSPSEEKPTNPLPPADESSRADREATPVASAPAPKEGGRERSRKGESSRSKHRHRRASSSHRVKETLDAVSTRGPEGRRTVNQYRLGPELGKGAFGTVELGVDLQTGEKYAVKEYSKARLRRQVRQRSMAAARGRGGRVGQTSMREMEEQAEKNPLSLIAREVAIMKKLDHPNLVHLYEVLDVPLSDGLFMVLEYCPGGILLDLPQPPEPPNPPMGLFRARHYFGQLLMALEYLHENDVVHRDIKPENILLTVDKQTAKMCDFGVSEMFAKKGEDKVKKGSGSPAFMSPESIDGGSEIEAKPADVWALGVTLYCMLSGHLPFAHENPIELYESIKSHKIELPEDWHDDQKDLIMGMLNRDPEARLTVDQIRNHAWLVPADLPSKEENLSDERMVVEPTAEELSQAVRSVSSAFAVIRAVQKFKRLTASKRSSRASTMDSSVFSEDGSSPSASPHPSPRPAITSLHPDSSQAGPSRSSSTSNSHLAPPALNDEPEEIGDEITDEPATFDEPEELADQFYRPQSVARPKSPNERSMANTDAHKHPGIADEMSDEPASMEGEGEGDEVQGSQETAKLERPNLSLQVPGAGLSERFSKMGCVVVESPGGGRQEIG